MKSSQRLFLAVLFAFPAGALAFSQEALSSFAEKYSYRDNLGTLKRDKVYSAQKGCCGSEPHVTIEGFPGKGDFKQVALWCDHCGISQMSDAQLSLCRDQFRLLFDSLTGRPAPAKLMSKLSQFRGPADDHWSTSGLRVRLSSGELKCDDKGGVRFRIDLFAE